jgi:hypothetical protein
MLDIGTEALLEGKVLDGILARYALPKGSIFVAEQGYRDIQ